MKITNNNRNNKVNNIILSASFAIIIVIILNILFDKINVSIDLTQDKRYTLHPQTEKLLKELNQPVHISVLLYGDDLQKGFKRLSSKTEESIRQFQKLSSGTLTYEMIDPMQADSSFIQGLNEQNITSFPVTVPLGKGATKQIQVFPWAIVTVGERKMPVMLQEYSSPKLSNADLNQSEILLEYKLANAIKRLTQYNIDTILYLTGNGQPEDYQVYDLANSISREFVFEALSIKDIENIPNKYKAILIQKPTLPFTEIDKWKIDQYLMRGGNILMCIDGVKASTDSLFQNGQFIAVPNELNISDMLFRYGMRLNMNLLSDGENFVDFPLQSPSGATEQFPWVYYPILKSHIEHPIVKNLSELLMKYPSTLDIANIPAGVRATTLLQSSNTSRIEATPLLIKISSAVQPIMKNEYQKKYLTTGVLLEGKFKSLYSERIPEELSSVRSRTSTHGNKPGKIAFYADGDIFLNEISQKSGPLEMGQYIFSAYKFNNKELLLNTLTYLTDTNHLLDVKNKNYQASLLDYKRVEEERSLWQTINILVPAAIAIIFGLFFNLMRKKRYQKKLYQ